MDSEIVRHIRGVIIAASHQTAEPVAAKSVMISTSAQLHR
jgi:hypothetical protein